MVSVAKKPWPRKPQTCPSCGGQSIATIIYGYVAVDEDLERDLEAGKFTLGGCCITDNDPSWECNACGTKFGFPKGEPSPRKPPAP